MSGNNRGKKILLVDDDQGLRTVLAEQLDLYDGFTTIQVGTAAEGWRRPSSPTTTPSCSTSACPTWTAASSAG